MTPGFFTSTRLNAQYIKSPGFLRNPLCTLTKSRFVQKHDQGMSTARRNQRFLKKFGLPFAGFHTEGVQYLCRLHNTPTFRKTLDLGGAGLVDSWS